MVDTTKSEQPRQFVWNVALATSAHIQSPSASAGWRSRLIRGVGVLLLLLAGGQQAGVIELR
jgi:hypothetical protein